ncbi:MAG TPA: class I SAM-dependent methyltransferase [Tepidisphaeraceae bacterium]|nr:class I SAM-dependent methyltransferase [Tepidisphaeraceae bacterium]
MRLPDGIPSLKDLGLLKNTDFYRQHVDFNRQFIERHQKAMAGYGRHWGLDPFKLWSRRWEYPYVAQRLLEFKPAKVLDAGSGVTYFPYFIIENLPQTQFICCDYDPSYAPMFQRINHDRQQDKVSFLQCPLQSLPLGDASLDAICCISVLEHTDNYAQIVEEFARVLKPGGLLVITFDLSLDGKFTLPRREAAELMLTVSRRFDFAGGIDPQQELNRMNEDGILTSDYVRRTEPHLLPWSFPVRVYKAATDLLSGKGWTGGFRSRTIFCMHALKKTA